MRPRSSRKGLSSTRSRLATRPLSCSISMTRCASRNVAPPGTVVPTAGAIAGSRKSTSRLTCSRPSCRRDAARGRRAAGAAMPCSSIARMSCTGTPARPATPPLGRVDAAQAHHADAAGIDAGPASREDSRRSPAGRARRPPACRAGCRSSWCRACGSRDGRRATARTAAGRASAARRAMPGERARPTGCGRRRGRSASPRPPRRRRRRRSRPRSRPRPRAAPSAPRCRGRAPAPARATTAPRSTTRWPSPAMRLVQARGAQRARAHLAAEPTGAILDGRAEQPAEVGSVWVIRVMAGLDAGPMAEPRWAIGDFGGRAYHIGSTIDQFGTSWIRWTRNS